MVATMFNWSCLMNDAYKHENPHPHLHFHVRPRYKNPININDKVFYDSEFAHHYNNKAVMDISMEGAQELFITLKNKVNEYF